jgi:hypothetical protein
VRKETAAKKRQTERTTQASDLPDRRVIYNGRS